MRKPWTKGLGDSRKGDMAENYALTWLWDNGYEVFMNSGSTGPVDMIAMDKNGEVLKIDVKSESWSTKRNKFMNKAQRTDLQKKLGVQFITYNPVTRKLRFVKHID